MKTYLTYGIAMAIAGLIVNLVLYLLGFHSDTAKLPVAQIIGMCSGLAISITCITLGIKARRAQIPAQEEFSYGQALGAGVMVALVASFLGIFTYLLYAKVINPGFSEFIVQAELHKLEAKNIPAASLEKAEGMIRTMTNPLLTACFAFIGGMIFGTVISLVAAAFLKRPAQPDTFASPPIG